MWASASVVPFKSAITIARLCTSRPGDIGAGHGRTDGDVLYAKLNDFYLGVYISLAIKRLLSRYKTE